MSKSGSKKEAKIKSFMIVQDYNPDHFNTEHGPDIQNIQGTTYEMFYWSDISKSYISSRNIAKVTDMVRFLLCSSMTDTETFYNNDVVDNIYGITHDSDKLQVWDKKLGDYVIQDKIVHFHIAVELGIPLTLKEISYKLNIAPQYIEKPKTGPYGLDNFLSYLIHAKDTDKYQYSPEDVFSHEKNKKSYMDIYSERRSAWLKGAAKKTRKRAIDGIEELEDMIMNGSITKEQILLTNDLARIYAANVTRVDNAFNVYLQVKMAKTIKAMENNEFRTAIFFITGNPHSGKSHFTRSLAKGIIDFIKVTEGEDWTCMDCAASNSVDNYLGEEIIMMDDLRGAAMTASDWLRLMNNDSVHDISARYRNVKVAPRCIIINSVYDPLHFFYYVKGVGGGDRSEPMDQFLRRIIANVQVFVVPDENDPYNPALFDRRLKVGICQLGDKQTVYLSNEKDFWGNHKHQVNVSWDFKPDYKGRDLSHMTTDEAKQFLINTVWYWSFGAKHTTREVSNVVGYDDYIDNKDIVPIPSPLTPDEADEEQAYHDELMEEKRREVEEANKEETISEIIDQLRQNLFYTDSNGQQCTNQPIIDGLENGTLTIAKIDGKITVVPNTDNNKKDGENDDN